MSGKILKFNEIAKTWFLWDKLWILPAESDWCTNEKFLYMNGLNHKMMSNQSQVSVMDKSSHKTAYWTNIHLFDNDKADHIRICPVCLKQGYHSDIHQIKQLTHCFIHKDVPLIDTDIPSDITKMKKSLYYAFCSPHKVYVEDILSQNKMIGNFPNIRRDILTALSCSESRYTRLGVYGLRGGYSVSFQNGIARVLRGNRETRPVTSEDDKIFSYDMIGARSYLYNQITDEYSLFTKIPYRDVNKDIANLPIHDVLKKLCDKNKEERHLDIHGMAEHRRMSASICNSLYDAMIRRISGYTCWEVTDMLHRLYICTPDKLKQAFLHSWYRELSNKELMESVKTDYRPLDDLKTDREKKLYLMLLFWYFAEGTEAVWDTASYRGFTLGLRDAGERSPIFLADIFNAMEREAHMLPKDESMSMLTAVYKAADEAVGILLERIYKKYLDDPQKVNIFTPPEIDTKIGIITSISFNGDHGYRIYTDEPNIS